MRESSFCKKSPSDASPSSTVRARFDSWVEFAYGLSLFILFSPPRGFSLSVPGSSLSTLSRKTNI